MKLSRASVAANWAPTLYDESCQMPCCSLDGSRGRLAPPLVCDFRITGGWPRGGRRLGTTLTLQLHWVLLSAHTLPTAMMPHTRFPWQLRLACANCGADTHRRYER